MIKFLSIVLVSIIGFQASADDLKVFRKANLSVVGLGRKGYIHCERVENGVRLIRVGRDKVERRTEGEHYRSRTEPNKIFVESKFKKSLAETEVRDQTFMDTDFIKNKYLKARDICDDHKALQVGDQLVRSREPGASDNDNDRDDDQQDAPTAPTAPSEPPPAPTSGTGVVAPDND